jgi:SAM-dependent methyltransferase
MRETPTLRIHTGTRAWDTIWKWTWFAREQWLGEFREQKKGTRRFLKSLLPELAVKSVLDSSCGLGTKTILLAEMGYDVEGCDWSKVAVRHAAELGREEGFDIRFFHSRWEKLAETAGRKYDCVYNDGFHWIKAHRSLLASAEGIHSVLKRGGKFIFHGAHQWSRDEDRKRVIEEWFQAEGSFEVLPVCEKDGIRLMVVITREKRPDGVLGSRIHVIDDHGVVRVEIAQVLDAYIWTWEDYGETLRKAGFRKIYSVKMN